MDKERLKQLLRNHERALAELERQQCNEEDIPEEVAEQLKKQADLFCNIRPKAVDILMEKEHEFVDAIKQLVEKHKSLETVDQIDKLTKDILKLCK